MESKLKKELGFFSVFCIVAGAMISSGIFILPGLAYAKAGPAVVLSYIIAAILMLPAVMSTSELVTAMPKAGGVYFFIDRSFGPAVGTFGGIANWMAISLKSAFAMIGIGEFASLIWPGMTLVEVKLIAVACCLIFMLINIRGAVHAGRTQIVMVVLLISALLAYVIAGIPSIDVDSLRPFMPEGFGAVISTAGFVFISYGGLTKAASVAEEVREPEKNIPRGEKLSLFVVGMLYALVVLVTVGAGGEGMKVSMTPVSDSARVFLGTPGMIAMSLAAMLAFVTTGNAGIMAASRDLLAMSRDRLLPHFLKRVNHRFKTPHCAILFTTAFMLSVILFLNLENLVKTASTLMIILFLLLNVSVIAMREAKFVNYRPKFKSPLYPWMQILGICGNLLLVVQMGVVPILTTIIFFAGVFVWYWFYVRVDVRRESALVCVIQRIADRNFVCENIESELRDIIRERDDIVDDRFDKVIRECSVLDIEKSISAEGLFTKIAENFSGKMGFDAKTLKDKMMRREQESSTVLAPGLAVPHIVVDGNGVFEMVIVRGREGIIFPCSDVPVHAVFVMFGSRDERNFHLRALMAIAQIVEGHKFMEMWMDARGVDELRDVILTAERRRNI